MASAPALNLNREDSRGMYADEQLAAALAYFRGGRYDKADEIYRKILKKNPANAGALHMSGLVALKRGRTERATQLLVKAAKASPDRPEILCDLGNAFKATGRHRDAIKAHKMVVDLLPKSPEALSNLGAAYKAAGKPELALEPLEAAVTLRPADPEFRFNLGNGLIAVERYEEAEAALRQVIYDKPDHVRAHINLGVSLKEMGKFDAAVERFSKAIAVSPDVPEAHWNMALMQLALGRFEEGWREYEWRGRLPGFAMQALDRPQWQGEPLNGRTLLVHAEQGLGDTVQFCRYLPKLASFGGKVIFACQDRLIPLIETLDGAPEIVPLSARPKHDVQTPLLSLPRFFNDGLPLLPDDRSYLSPDRARIAAAAEMLGPAKGLRVGIAWQGSDAYRHDARRSIPLACYELLARVDGVELISLQHGNGTEQISDIDWADRLTVLPEDIDADGAFLDTAAVIANLHMVVTSDTSIAHVAGAIGAPVTVALCNQPDWRWGYTSKTAPWYPSMRLVRQQKAHDWPGVFAEIARGLAQRIRGAGAAA